MADFLEEEIKNFEILEEDEDEQKQKVAILVIVVGSGRGIIHQ